MSRGKWSLFSQRKAVAAVLRRCSFLPSLAYTSLEGDHGKCPACPSYAAALPRL